MGRGLWEKECGDREGARLWGLKMTRRGWGGGGL